MWGEIIRKARERRGWSQAKLAEEAGVSRRHVGQVETGQAPRVSLDVFIKLVRALELPSIELDGVLIDPGGDEAAMSELAERLDRMQDEVTAARSLLRVVVAQKQQQGSVFDRAKQDMMALFDRLEEASPSERDQMGRAMMTAMGGLVASDTPPRAEPFMTPSRQQSADDALHRAVIDKANHAGPSVSDVAQPEARAGRHHQGSKRR